SPSSGGPGASGRAPGPSTARSSPTRSAFRTTGSRWTTRTPTRRRSAPARSPHAARSSAASAARGPFIGGNAVRLAAERVRERILDIASKELEIDAHDLTIEDGEVIAKGAPQKSIGVADVADAATDNYGELISGSST